MKSPDVPQGIRASFSSGLSHEALCQSIDCSPLAIADDMPVDPEGYTDVTAAELIPDHGDRALNPFRCDRVSECVKFDAGIFNDTGSGAKRYTRWEKMTVTPQLVTRKYC